MVRVRPALLLVLCLCGAQVAQVEQVAHAHAPPEVRSLVFDAAGSLRVLVANRGLILGDTAMAAQLMCNEALQLSTDQLPAIALREDASLLAATPLGLFVTADRACSWQRQGFFDASVSFTSLAQADAARAELWLAANTGPGGLYESTDQGSSWKRRWSAQAGDYLSDVLLGAASPRQVYALRAKLEASAVVYSVLRSSDAGDHWQEQPLALHTDEQPSLLAVDPQDPAHLLAKAAVSDTSQRERLLVSRDGASSFASPLSLYEIKAASWSEDGARAWVASEEGLYLSTDQGQSFARVGSGELLSCVQERAGRLYTCGFFAGVSAQQEGVGVSDDGGQTFQPWLLFHDVQAALACSPDAETARRCELPWIDWQNEQGAPALPSPDASAASDAGSTKPPKPAKAKSNSGCATLAPGAHDAHDVIAVLLLTGALLRRQRGRS